MNHFYRYYRHSTEQKDQPNSKPAQALEISHYIDRHQELTALEDGGEFWDADVSGGVPLFKRPAGSRLKARLQKGDHIVSARFDRLFRNVKDFVEVAEWCIKNQISLHVADRQIDTSSAGGRAVAQILAVFAEWELGTCGERVKRALASVKYTKGVAICYATPIGWKRVRKHNLLNQHGHPYATLSKDQEERNECEEIVMRRDKLQWSFQEIATFFNRNHKIPVAKKREGKINRRSNMLWSRNSVTNRYKAAKEGYPAPPDMLDGENREQLMIAVSDQ